MLWTFTFALSAAHFYGYIGAGAPGVPNDLSAWQFLAPEYESYRKLQVYETAVQAALEDGHISDRQRRVLDSMIGSISIDAKITDQLENDARAAEGN